MKSPRQRILTTAGITERSGNFVIEIPIPSDPSELSKHKHDLRSAQAALKTLLTQSDTLTATDIQTIKLIIKTAFPVILEEVESIIHLYRKLEPAVTPVDPTALLIARKRATEASHE